MGQNLANPVGSFWSAVMMLEHLGEHSAASKLMRVIQHITAQPRWHTRDLGGRALTTEVTAEALRLINSI
jgi:tartrate dehydrogenase/decarboxylase/D-malate dehydrogenase